MRISPLIKRISCISKFWKTKTCSYYLLKRQIGFLSTCSSQQRLHNNDKNGHQASRDIETFLRYTVVDGQRPYVYLREKQESDNPRHAGVSGGSTEIVKTTVKNARELDLKLDETSFELFTHETTLSTEDFYASPEKISTVYYDEMKELLTRVTGCSHVEIIHHQVRNQQKMNGSMLDMSATIQGYADAIHSDTDAFSAEQLFKYVASDNAELASAISEGRFMYLNVWRNISNLPVENHHLAVCDESSLVKPDDYITAEVHGPGYDSLQYRLNHRNSSFHKWYYYPGMKKTEVLVFKHWDSDTTKPARLCFHSSFKDPDASDVAASRESIEVRAIACFPDHVPNTLPALPKNVIHEGSEDEQIQAGVDKILNAIESLSYWPQVALKWLKNELTFGEKGVENIVKVLALDQYGHLGLKSLPEERRQKIVESVLKSNFESKLRSNFAKVQHFVKTDVHNVSIYSAVASSALALAFGCIIGIWLSK